MKWSGLVALSVAAGMVESLADMVTTPRHRCHVTGPYRLVA